VTSEKIEQNLDYIASNLQIGIVLDKLFERQLITIDEHDGVQRKVTKPEKRRTLLSLLLSRPDTNWLSGFIRVLHNTGHINLLERLRQHVSNDQGKYSSPLGTCNKIEKQKQTYHTVRRDPKSNRQIVESEASKR
jgi:hypothetical protein